MSNIKKSAAYFKAYPKVDAFCVTSDGSFFPEENKSMAESHQLSLKKGKIEIITRKEAGVLSNDAAAKAKADAVEAKKAADAKAKADAAEAKKVAAAKAKADAAEAKKVADAKAKK